LHEFCERHPAENE
jgi:hypothetical protein